MVRHGAFLTETQANYLRGDFEPPNKNAERQLRSQIRERTRGALTDFALVANTMGTDDRKLIAESDTPPGEGPLEYTNHSPNRAHRLTNREGTPKRRGNESNSGDPDAADHDKMSADLQVEVLDTLRYLFDLCEQGNVNPQDAVEAAIVSYYERKSMHDYVANLSIQVQKGEANKARKKMQRGEKLSATEVKALMEEGYQFPDPEERN